jgi:predicted nucleic acid-binding protein
MREYLLDSGPLSGLLFNRPHVVSLARPWIEAQEAATSILVYGEVSEYLFAQQSSASLQLQLRGLLRAVIPYLPTYAILERYARLRRRLRPPYGLGLIGDIDTLIAATAIEHDLTVVTMDDDFQRIPELNVLLLPRR